MYSDTQRANAARIGREGERRVAEYLRSKGYIIVRMNYRDRFGEIDIVAEKEDTIAFVEVKTRYENAMVSGFEAITPQKQRRIRLTASSFLQKIPGDYIGRFDAAQVEVFLKEDGTEGWRLKYLKNAF